MKKLALSLLFATAIVTNSLAVATTTNFGPMQVEYDGAAGTFGSGITSMSGTINIGQSSSDTIRIQGADISTGATLGNGSLKTVMSVDSGNNVVAGILIQLGDASGNYILTNDLGNLSVNAVDGDLVLNAIGAREITLVSQSISSASSISDATVLAVNSSGVVATTDAFDVFVLGNNAGSAAYIAVDNSSVTPTGITLNTGNQSNITLNPGASNNIVFSASANITLPTTGGHTFLMLDSNGNVETPTATTSVTCGSLTAAGSANGQTISLGYPSTGNSLTFTNNSGDIDLSALVSGANLSLAASGNISISGTNISPTTNSTPAFTVLALDRNGNLVTSNLAEVFVLGNNDTNNNNITIDNDSTANGIAINSEKLSFVGQGLAPAAGFTNVLTIDADGKIGVVISSETKKQNIQSLQIDENAFDSLEAVSYQYKGKDRIEYGFIAESLVNNDALKHSVIYAQDGTVMSINYQAVFVALTAQFLKTKRELNDKIKSLESQLVFKDESLYALEAKYNKLEAAIAEIANKIISQQ
jgi:hypothetical protein